MARRTWWKVGALLAAMMVFLTMLPATALAADTDTVYVGGVTLTGSTDSPVYATTNEDTGVVTPITSTEGEPGDWNVNWWVRPKGIARRSTARAHDSGQGLPSWATGARGGRRTA